MSVAPLGQAAAEECGDAVIVGGGLLEPLSGSVISRRSICGCWH